MVTMTQPPPTGLWREPVIPALPTTREQIEWARRRPSGQRAGKPRPTQVVGLRLQPGGPVVKARIIEVRDTPPADTRPGVEIDWNVWCYTLRVSDPKAAAGPVQVSERGDRQVELVEDPWWDCLLETLEGPRMRIECREARLPGAPGWVAEG